MKFGALTVCPTPKSNRWRRAEGLEGYLMVGVERCDPSEPWKVELDLRALAQKKAQLLAVIEEIKVKKVEASAAAKKRSGKGRGKGAPSRASGGENELQQEETLEHIEKVTKWAKAARAAIGDDDFWAALIFSRTSRRVVDQLFWRMEKQRRWGRPRNLARLVWGGAREVMKELEKLVADESVYTWDHLHFSIPDEVRRRA